MSRPQRAETLRQTQTVIERSGFYFRGRPSEFGSGTRSGDLVNVRAYSFFLLLVSSAIAVVVALLVASALFRAGDRFSAEEQSFEVARRIAPFEVHLRNLNRRSQNEMTRRIHFIGQYIENFSPRIDGVRAKGLALDIFSESHNAGVDPFLVASVVESESSFQTSARSNKAAYGLMQIQPATARFTAQMMNASWRGESSLLSERTYNLQLGIAYLKYLQNRFDGDMKKALIAYNWGPSNLDLALAGEKRIPSSVVNYAEKILARQAEFHLQFEEAKQSYGVMNANFVPEAMWKRLAASAL